MKCHPPKPLNSGLRGVAPNFMSRSQPQSKINDSVLFTRMPFALSFTHPCLYPFLHGQAVSVPSGTRRITRVLYSFISKEHFKLSMLEFHAKN